MAVGCCPVAVKASHKCADACDSDSTSKCVAALPGAGYLAGAGPERNRLAIDASCHINRLTGGVRNVREEWPDVTRPSQGSPPGEDCEHSRSGCSKSNAEKDMYNKSRCE